jgi:hypothetical protein
MSYFEIMISMRNDIELKGDESVALVYWEARDDDESSASESRARLGRHVPAARSTF